MNHQHRLQQELDALWAATKRAGLTKRIGFSDASKPRLSTTEPDEMPDRVGFHRGDRVSVAVWPGRTLAHAAATLVHEVAHHLLPRAPEAPIHGPAFARLLAKLAEARWGIGIAFEGPGWRDMQAALVEKLSNRFAGYSEALRDDIERDRVVERCRKLLAMATHDRADPNEAARAAHHAQRLMEAHAIKEIVLGDSDAVEDPAAGVIGRRVHIHHTGIVPTWLVRLINTVCHVNRVAMCYRHGRYVGRATFTGYGQEADLGRVAQMVAWLLPEVDRLWAEESRRPDRPRGRAYATGFRVGVVRTISDRLWAARREEAEAAKERARKEDAAVAEALQRVQDEVGFDRTEQPYALAKVERGLERLQSRERAAYDYVNRVVKPRGGRRSSEADGTGYQRGREAGARARLQGGRHALTG